MTSTDSAQPDVLYTARVAVTGGRGGSARSETGSLQVDLARPAERGTENAGTDPEELFAAGFAACFDSALAVAARREKIKVGTTSTTAAVSLTSTPEGRFALTVSLDVHAPDCPQADLERAVEVAETLCPYANAVRGNVPLAVRARGQQ